MSGRYEPSIVLSFDCEKSEAKRRYLARKRGDDDEAMFEKRYAEFEKENPALEKHFGDLGMLLKVNVRISVVDFWLMRSQIDTNGATEVSYEKLITALKENEEWKQIDFTLNIFC